MAFPARVQTSQGAQNTDSTSHPITMPAGITAGNYLFIFFSCDCNTADAEYVDAVASAGWTRIAYAQNGNFNNIGAIFAKQAAGGDTCTITTSAVVGNGQQQSTHIVHEVSGVGAWFVNSATSTGGSNTNPPNTNSGDGTQDLLVFATRHGDNTVVPSAAPTNYSNLVNQAAANAQGASTSTAERQVNASAADPGTFTVASEQWVSFTLVISPLARTGTIAQSAPKARQAAVGTETISGAIVQSAPKAAQATAGTETISGAIIQTAPGAEQAATGTVTSGVTGTIAQTAPKAGQQATGTETISGAIIQSAPKAAQAIVGAQTISGTIAQSAPKARQAAAGTETISGAIVQTAPKAAQAATGTETISGAIAQSAPKARQVAAGGQQISGTVTQTAPSAGQSAAGTETIIGTVNQSAPKAGQAAAGTETISGAIVQVAPKARQAASGMPIIPSEVKKLAFIDIDQVKTISSVANQDAQRIIGVPHNV